MKIKMIRFSELESKLKTSFRKQANNLRSEIINETGNLYPSSNSRAIGGVEGHNSLGGFAVSFKVGIESTNRDAEHPVFLEYGTGVYMPDWWSPSMWEAQVGSGRTKSRPGKEIGGRGEGAGWSFNGKSYPGSDKLHFKGRNGWVTVDKVQGRPGQRRFNKKLKEIYTEGRLMTMAKAAFRDGRVSL